MMSSLMSSRSISISFASTFSMQIFKFQRRSCKFSLLFPPICRRTLESFLEGQLFSKTGTCTSNSGTTLLNTYFFIINYWIDWGWVWSKELCRLRWVLDEADYTLWDLHNFSHHAKAISSNCYNIHYNIIIFIVLKQSKHAYLVRFAISFHHLQLPVSWQVQEIKGCLVQ